MAKSSSFFGLRRGSTKSLTFAVMNGKQITKDRVTSVRNPNTTAQINQRMRLAAANVIYKWWKNYIDRGQQNVAYGEKSRLAWMSSVLKSPLYIAKGSTSYLPWTFPITRGSLTPFDCSKTAIGMVNNLIAPYNVSDAANLTDAQILANNPQLKEGDQIAVIGMYNDANENTHMVEIKHYLKGETTLAADAEAVGCSITLPPVGSAPEEGESDSRYRVCVFDAPQFNWDAFTCILSRQDGTSYLRSTQEVVALTETYFTTSFIQYLMMTWQSKGTAVDWPEIQGTFTPRGYKSVIVYSTEDSSQEDLNVVLVYGVDEQGYKAFAVTQNGAATTGALLNQQTMFGDDPSYTDFAANTLKSTNGDSSLLPVSGSRYGSLANGVISYAEFKTVFG